MVRQGTGPSLQDCQPMGREDIRDTTRRLAVHHLGSPSRPSAPTHPCLLPVRSGGIVAMYFCPRLVSSQCYNGRADGKCCSISASRCANLHPFPTQACVYLLPSGSHESPSQCRGRRRLLIQAPRTKKRLEKATNGLKNPEFGDWAAARSRAKIRLSSVCHCCLFVVVVTCYLLFLFLLVVACCCLLLRIFINGFAVPCCCRWCCCKLLLVLLLSLRSSPAY